MSKIFISYASEDRPRAKIIAEALEHQGYSVWWDVDIPPGKTFDNTIKVELDSAKCIIVLWSWKSVLSDWVKEESSEGVKRKILIPVLIDDVEIPLGFKRIQAARLIDWSGTLPNPEFDILLKSVKELVGQKQSLKVQEIKKEEDHIETEKKEIVEVIEKTRILGTILDSDNRNPAQEASIKLSIEGRQIASITSNKQGEYEFIAEQDYTGQTLDISIEKDNYIKKNIYYEIDRPTIKSDILLDEIKVKIKGKICDETDNPLDNGSISFSIGKSTIDLTSDKDGSFSFTVGQQFLNQSIGYEVNKEGFEIKSGKLKLLENLKCINISKSIPPTVSNKSMWIKNAVVGIGLIGLTGLVIYLFALPTGLEVSPDSIDFDTDNIYKEINISKKGLGTIDWDIDKSKDWITVTPTSGSNSRTIIVSIDKTGLDPVNHTGNIAISSEGGLLSKFYSETKIINVSLDIKPTSKPKIHSFIAEPNHIDGKEGETTLSWEVTNATSVTIDGVRPVKVPKGSIDKQVEQNTTFTLKATNDAGVSDVRTVTVTVRKEPADLVEIKYFTVNPDQISIGDKSTLCWDVSGVNSVTIEPEIGIMGLTGEKMVSPDESTTYILTATNEAGISDVRAVTVTVGKEPADLVEIKYFTVNPDQISIGDKSTLCWDVSGVNSVTIEPEIGIMGLTGEKMVSPNESTTYILTATNEAGISDVKTITVTVEKEPADLVEIKYFTVNPDQISIGDKSTLCWDVSGVNNVTIKPEIGIMGLTGEKMVFPDESTTYILTATNEAGISDIKKVTVTVGKQMPELSVNPDPLDLNYSTMDEGDTDSRTFSISNTGNQTLEWSISDNQPWITVNPTSGINSGEVIVTVNTVKLKPGDYSGIITIESNGGNKNGTINLIKEGITTPTQLSPGNGSIFDHYPRTTTLEWEAVLGAMSYTVEIDCYHCYEIDQWCTDIGETWKIQSDIQTTSYAFNYVNTEPGRWRVWAVNANGQESVKSSWWYFEYIV
jgi:hypothetical protein